MKKIFFLLMYVLLLFPSCSYLKISEMRRNAQDAFAKSNYKLAREIYDGIKRENILSFLPEDELKWEQSVLQIAIDNYKNEDLSTAYSDFQILEYAQKEIAMWSNYYLALITLSNDTLIKDIAFYYLYNSIINGIDTNVIYNNKRLAEFLNSYCISMTVEDLLNNKDILVELSTGLNIRTNFELFRITYDLNNDGIEEIIVLSGMPYFDPYPNYRYCRLLIYQYELSLNKFMLKLEEGIELSEVPSNNILQLPNNGDLLSKSVYCIDLNGDANNELLLPIKSYAGPGGTNGTLFIIGYSNNFQIIRLSGKIGYTYQDSPYLIHYSNLNSGEKITTYYLDSTYKLTQVFK